MKERESGVKKKMRKDRNIIRTRGNDKGKDKFKEEDNETKNESVRDN